MTIPVLAIGDYIVTFEDLEEDISPRHHFIKECGWSEAKFRSYERKGFPFFCAKVAVWKDGVELNAQFLGCCSYETVEEFYTRYKGDYFCDMVLEAFEELKLPEMMTRAKEVLSVPQTQE